MKPIKTEQDALDALRKSLELYKNLPSKREFVEKYLKPLLMSTELDVQDCFLSQDEKKVLLSFAGGAQSWIKVEGDNRFGLCLDVLKALDCR